MTSEREGPSSRLGGRLVFPALALAGAAALFFAARGAAVSDAAPAYVRDLFGPEPGPTPVLCFSLLLLWIGMAPAWLSMGLLARPILAIGLPVWAGVLAFVAWLLARAAWPGLPGADWGWEEAARWAVLGWALVLVVILASAVAGAVATMTRGEAARCVGLFLLLGVPWVVLARLVFVGLESTTASWRPLRSGQVPGDVMLMLLVFLSALSAAVLGHALRRPRWGAMAGALALAAALVPVGWFLVHLAVAPAVGPGADKETAVRVLLGAEGAGAAGAGLFLRWALAQAGAVVILAYGHMTALFLLPRRHFVAALEPPAAWPAERFSEPQAARRRSRAPRPPSGRAYGGLAIAYALLTVYGSLVPLEFHGLPFADAVERFARVRYLSLGIENRADLVANLLLFAPLGFLAMGAVTGAGARAGRWAWAFLVTAAGAALAVAIEFAQVCFPPRTVSLNDILAECVGGAVGALVWLAFGVRVTEWLRTLRRSRSPRRVAAALLGGYAVALALYQLFPFDFVLAPEELARKMQEGRIVLAPFAGVGWPSLLVMIAKACMWVPIGYWTVVRSVRPERPVWRAFRFGLLVVFSLEVVRVFVYSRFASSTEVILGAVGAGVGGWVAQWYGPAATRQTPRGAAWVLLGFAVRFLAAAGLVAALVYGKWQPFDLHWPAEGLAARAWSMVQVPFFHQYWNTEYQAAVQLLGDIGVPVVLGLLLRSLALGWRVGGIGVPATVAAVIPAVIEAGQVLFPPHMADLTTVILAAAGGVAGVLLYTPFARTFVERGPSAEAAEAGRWTT